jgi:FKBP-type peptidyl-prolyl cis-trans isomerase
MRFRFAALLPALALTACAAAAPRFDPTPAPGRPLDGVARDGTEADWTAAQAAYLAWNAARPGWTTTASGLQYRRLGPEGSGDVRPTRADRVRVHYQGTFIDGREFDSSWTRGEPAVFPVARVVPGFSEALTLMRPGETFEIVIPADLAYGDRWRGGDRIPPNSALKFRIQLIEISSAG